MTRREEEMCLGPTQGDLTFGKLQLVSSLLKPASGMNVRGIGIDPEVVALGITIKVQAQAVAAHLAGEKESEAGQCQQAPPSASFTSPGPACSLRDPVLAGSLRPLPL